MAMNPMQRRARNAFLVGFLIAVIIMALVVVLLLYRMKGITEERDSLLAAQSSVLVASKNLRSGAVLSQTDSVKTETVITSIPSDQILTVADFESNKINTDGEPLEKELILKIDVPSGTIITKDMVEEEENQVSASQRIQEYSMIVLPSQLKNDDYIDIRLSLPNGQDFIVLSKKRVIGTNEKSIWMQLDEDELLILNNAIVESYTITGSKLYALSYVEAGRQDDAIPTYNVSANVLTLIKNDPNITAEARDALGARYNADIRMNYLEPALDPNRDGQDSLVSSGIAADVENAQSARQTFVESLEGTNDIGYNK